MITDATQGMGRRLLWQSTVPDVWVTHWSGARFGFKVTDLPRLAALEGSVELAPIELNTAINEVLEAEDLQRVSPFDAASSDAPLVRREWRKIALIEAATTELADQVSPSVLALDRVLALDQIGLHADATNLASQHLFTLVEVTELLHDAGLAEDQNQDDLMRLLRIAGQTNLLEDLMHPPDMSVSTDSAVEHMLREVLAPPAPPVYLDGTEAEPAAFDDQEARLVWRVGRRFRAMQRAVTLDVLAESKRSVGRLVEGELKMVEHELAARVLRESLGQRSIEGVDDEPEPLLAEVIHCVLAAQPMLEGSLAEAVRRDSEGSVAACAPT